MATVTDSIDGDPRILRPNTAVVAAAGLLLLGGAVALAPGFGWRQATLYLVGGALGLTLYHASFGFAASWRVFLVDRRGAGLRAQMLMLTVATLLFFPVLADGTLFGRPVGGALAPLGVSVLVGAFIFGIGMQLGGACASGTLYTAGSGNTRTMLTLPAFIAGAFLATAHFPWWLDRPSLGTISVIRELGRASCRERV